MRALLATVCLTAACTGDIKVGKGVEPVVPPPAPRPVFVPQPAGLRILTARQYAASLEALFGPAAARRLGAWTTSLAAAQGGISATQVEDYETAALDVAARLFASGREALVGCTPAVADEACARTWLSRTGRLAFRRPLGDDELQRYLNVSRVATTELGGDPWKGLELSTAALLQSPNFLYRVELAEQGRFDAYALASRLSFTLINAPPDAALLDAAEGGTLLSPEVLRAHTRRLMRDVRARAALEQLLADWLQLDDVEHLEKDPGLFPGFTPALAASMRDELVTTLGNHLIDEARDFRDLFDNRVTFVDGRLAQHYGLVGVAPDAPLTRVTLPEGGPRAGLLGFAGVLALQATPVNTSPTLRGKFVRTTFLCQTIPPPPADVDTTLPPPMPGLSTRARLDQHRTNPSCASCHALMDPIGFGLESFDATGAHRETSQGVAIDASGSVDGVAFADARGLSAALKGHRRSASCFVRQVYRYALGHVEAPGEIAALDDLEAAFVASGHKLEPLLEALALHAAFQEAAP